MGIIKGILSKKNLGRTIYELKIGEGA